MRSIWRVISACLLTEIFEMAAHQIDNPRNPFIPVPSIYSSALKYIDLRDQAKSPNVTSAIHDSGDTGSYYLATGSVLRITIRIEGPVSCLSDRPDE